MTRAVGIGLVIALAMATALGGGVGCQEGNGLGGADLAQGPDLLPPADLMPPTDLTPPPNCGKIVFCALGCLGSGGIPGIGGGGGTGGASDAGAAGAVGCVLGCGQNAQPADIGDALSLVVCAAQNCLAADGGSTGQLGILQCLSNSCPTQLASCKGLGLG